MTDRLGVQTPKLSPESSSDPLSLELLSGCCVRYDGPKITRTGHWVSMYQCIFFPPLGCGRLLHMGGKNDTTICEFMCGL